MSRLPIRALIVLAVAFSGACVTNPETGRESVVLVPDSIMNNLGASSYAEILKTEKVSTDDRINAIVARVAGRITSVTTEQMDWELQVIESNQANAFVLPGGKIVVYTGILPVCETEAGLAFVVGHEVGHAIARHGGERVSQTLVIQGGLAVSDILLQQNAYRSEIMAAMGVGAQYGVLLPFSRAHESEADYMGLRYMARAGYDPRVAPQLWVRMGQLSGGQQPPEFASTHPSHERRTAELEANMDEAMALYQAAPQQYGVGENL